MQLPAIAIIGRPNVGKSTLLNAAAGRRVSVVDDLEGVTRDRVGIFLTHDDRAFELIDTGGIGIVDLQELDEDVERQIQFAIDAADVLIFVVDARAGVTPLDKDIARRLRRLEKPLVFAANKSESDRIRAEIDEFRRLGFGAPIELSAQNREHVSDVLSAAVELLPPEEEEDDTEQPTAHLKVAIVGRRNAGKSTLVNALAGGDRVIVSEKPGTTRDAIDVWIERDGETWVLIDTAGFARRGGDGGDPIQWYGEHRAMRAIRYCDVVILLLDVTRKIAGLEKRLADAIDEAGKPCLLVANKWDLVEDTTTGDFDDYFRGTLPHLVRAPLAFISAKDRMNVQKMLNVSKELYAQGDFTLSTGELNRFLNDALEYRSPRIRSSRRPRIYYSTQVGTQPPTFALFVNDPDLFDPAYRRYLTNRFRDRYPVREVPVVFHFRRRDRKTLNQLKGGD